MGAVFILLFLPAILVFIEFFGFLFTGKRILYRGFLAMAEVGALIIMPFLYAGFGDKNDCCGDSTAFSPHHQLTIAVIIILCLAAYFYSNYRKTIAPPVIEVIVNALLVIGIVLNIFIAVHTEETFLWVLGNLPIILLGVLVLAKNQKTFIAYSDSLQYKAGSRFEYIAWKLLQLDPMVKLPIIFIISLPLLMIITALLLLFGQKPDSIIRAFTDTYQHGFSQWDHQCDNVQCGGHYLCSVAANGHKKIVQPQRLGTRNDNNIICNRQLLISNAFEDLMQEKLPFLHKIIRKQYNKVGDLIHRYYSIFNNKFVSDLIYILMKPAEWFFLFILYSLDKKPEDRIAKQYLSFTERQIIDNKTKLK